MKRIERCSNLIRILPYFRFWKKIWTNILFLQCLMAIVTAGEKGRNAFVGNRGIHYLCETVIRQTFRCEDALKVSNVIYAGSG